MLRKAKVCALDQLLLERSGGQVRDGALLATPPLAEHQGVEPPTLESEQNSEPKSGEKRVFAVL